jgi:type I restriction enzyme S subunit
MGDTRRFRRLKPVIPAKAGIHLDSGSGKVDPGLRRDDELTQIPRLFDCDTRDWTKATLGDLIACGEGELQTGPFGTVLKASEYSCSGAPVISVGEIQVGRIQLSDRTPRISDATKQRLPQFILENGDIVFGRKGGIDRNALIGSREHGWFLGSDGIRLRLSQRFDSRFMSYQLRLPAIGKWLLGNSAASIMPSLNEGMLMRLPVRFPSLSEQRKIASVLAALDAKIDLNHRINAELEALAKTIYDYWFVQFDFPDAHGRPYKSSGGAMVWNDTLKREIPAGWGDGVLSDIADITMGQSPSGDSYNEEGLGTVFFQGSTDFGIRSPEVRMFTTAPSRMARDGDILVSVRAPVGTLNIADRACCIGRGLAALHSKSGFDAFLFRVMADFKQVFDRRSGEGTTFGSITKDDLFGLKVLIPEVHILQAHARMANDWVRLAALRDKETHELTRLRDWLLPLLMNGQVRVA